MVRLPVSTGDAGALFEAFDPNRINLSGKIATITLELKPDAPEAEAGEALEAALRDDAFRAQALETASARVKKGLGPRYSIEDDAKFDHRAQAIRFTIGTLFDDTSSQAATAQGIAEVTRGVSDDIQSMLAKQFEVPTVIWAEWEAGEGLINPMSFAELTTDQSALEEHRSFLRWRRNKIASLRNWLLGVSVGLIALVILVVGVQHGGWLSALLLYAGLIVIAALVANRMTGSRIAELDDDIREAGNELDLRRIETDQGEARAQKLFQSHAFEIKRYYDQALRQGRSIYYVGIVCIGLGFAVIAGAFALVSSADSKDLSGQIIVGALGAIGAILANFIAVVYLRMFSETVQALTSFHQRLVITHHLHFGNFLASKIKDKKTRETALAEMSMGLSLASKFDLGGAQASKNGATGEEAKG
jgi:Cyanobacterial TRADD-N associated 2-Transmembrane domain